MPLALVLAKSPVTDVSDAQLAQRIARADRGALEALMRRYNQRLFRVARSILRNDADAEEAVQEAFFLAYRAMGKFRGDSSLSTWLVRIVVNESNKRLRKIRRLSSWLEFSDELENTADTVEANMNEYSPGQPEQVLARTQTRHLIESRIDQLPDAFRSVFILRAIEELSVEETAVCLGIPQATVRSRHFRARGLMRKMLKDEIDAGLGQAFSFAGARCDRMVARVMARLNEHYADQP